MTIEEAIEVFINRGYVNVKDGIIYNGSKWRQSVEVITKWFKEQPCEDTISRQAMLDAFWKLNVELRPNTINAILNMINDLPSVSTEKTGY